MPKIKMVIDIPDKIAKITCENSIERVINTTLHILESVEHDDRYVNQQDWIESKIMVIKLWTQFQDAWFRLYNKLPEQS